MEKPGLVRLWSETNRRYSSLVKDMNEEGIVVPQNFPMMGDLSWPPFLKQ